MGGSVCLGRPFCAVLWSQERARCEVVFVDMKRTMYVARGIHALELRCRTDG